MTVYLGIHLNFYIYLHCLFLIFLFFFLFILRPAETRQSNFTLGLINPNWILTHIETFWTLSKCYITRLMEK